VKRQNEDDKLGAILSEFMEKDPKGIHSFKRFAD
jgi:hypothetical protein